MLLLGKGYQNGHAASLMLEAANRSSGQGVSHQPRIGDRIRGSALMYPCILCFSNLAMAVEKLQEELELPSLSGHFWGVAIPDIMSQHEIGNVLMGSDISGTPGMLSKCWG